MRMPLLMLWEFGSRDFVVEGQAVSRAAIQMSFNVIGGEHFRTLKIPIIAGRDFAELMTWAPARGNRERDAGETLLADAGTRRGHRIQTPDW